MKSFAAVTVLTMTMGVSGALAQGSVGSEPDRASTLPAAPAESDFAAALSAARIRVERTVGYAARPALSFSWSIISFHNASPGVGGGTTITAELTGWDWRRAIEARTDSVQCPQILTVLDRLDTLRVTELGADFDPGRVQRLPPYSDTTTYLVWSTLALQPNQVGATIEMSAHWGAIYTFGEEADRVLAPCWIAALRQAAPEEALPGWLAERR